MESLLEGISFRNRCTNVCVENAVSPVRLFQVFQHRFDGSVDFFKTYVEYENGFGDVAGEFWMGML